MSLGNHTHTKHNRQKTTTHVGKGNIALMHITQLTKVVSTHLAMFDVIAQISFVNTYSNAVAIASSLLGRMLFIWPTLSLSSTL